MKPVDRNWTTNTVFVQQLGRGMDLKNGRGAVSNRGIIRQICTSTVNGSKMITVRLFNSRIRPRE